jgi:mRNA interferase MazF
MYMPSYSKGDVVLVLFPFSDMSRSKVRPVIVVSTPHASQDLFVISLTSKTARLLTGEFVLGEWKTSGLNVPSAVKCGVFTIHESLIVKSIGTLSKSDAGRVDDSLRGWLGI